MLAPTSEADLADSTLVELELDSLRRYPGFVAGIERLAGQSCGYRTDGTLWVALNRDQEGDLERLAAMQRARGSPRRGCRRRRCWLASRISRGASSRGC